MLLSLDNNRQTFLHHAALYGSAEFMRDIIAALPRELALDLSRVRDMEEKRARDRTGVGLLRDYLDQAGTFPTDFYHLLKPPTVLVFYMTKERQTSDSDTDAEAEKACIEDFCTENGFPCTVKADLTAEDIFSGIEEALDDASLSCLMVFVMSHGSKGLIQVSTDETSTTDLITIKDITFHMSLRYREKPKVSPVT